MHVRGSANHEVLQSQKPLRSRPQMVKPLPRSSPGNEFHFPLEFRSQIFSCADGALDLFIMAPALGACSFAEIIKDVRSGLAAA